MQKNAETRGMRLLQQGRRGLVHTVFSRLGLIVLLLVLQVFLLIGAFNWFAAFIPQIFGSTIIFNAVMVMILINSKADPTSKVTWLVIIMVMPLFGVLLYAYTRSDIGHRAMKERIKALAKESCNQLPQNPDTLQRLTDADQGCAALARYTGRNGDQPVWENTQVTYFPSGEMKFESLLAEMKKAEHFIYMEYFIIAEGDMWGDILTILADKVKQGVEVCVVYDGTCEFTTLSHDYPSRLRELGIKCKMFAPVTPFLSTHYNYRDHRKIVVIDGNTAFTGGVNLADEYINVASRFGHWKDAAVMMKGEAVRSFTLMFLEMWGMNERKADFTRLHTPVSAPEVPCPGFVMPYADYPLDDNRMGERVYMDILYRAKKYVHIMTPYLILDSNMENALTYAAERGVDVHLILPGIPDKQSAWWLARTHYASLIASGVKISEYEPGFVHAKVFVADDCEAVVGTINLDYRSLYHHFECACYMHGVPCVGDIEADFQDTLTKCCSVTEDTIRKIPWYQKLGGAALKAIAPLM